MSDVSVEQTDSGRSLLKLHLEPDAPVEIGELTGALWSLSKQYEAFVEGHGAFGKSADARLLVWSVAPGSIEIAFLPDLQAAAGLLASAYDPFKHLLAFAEHITKLIKLFSGEKKPDGGVTIKDCDNVTALLAPITNHGGTQSIVIVNGLQIHPVIQLSADEARQITGNARSAKFALAGTSVETHQRVPLVWKQLDRGKAKTETARSQDRGLIQEIDEKDRPVFFTNETTHLKEEMIGDDENPWQRVYFVDVEVSRHEGRIVSYRIVAYYGKENLD